mgnify:CR=1 FL=1
MLFRSTLFHEVERLNSFLGYTPSLALHAWFHVQNWMIIAPTVLTAIVAAPIFAIRRWAFRRSRSLDGRAGQDGEH